MQYGIFSDFMIYVHDLSVVTYPKLWWLVVWWCGDVFRDIQEIELRKGKLIECSEGSQE